MKQIVRRSKKNIPRSLMAKAGRALAEVWRRVEKGQFPYTKTQFCRLAGISPRWAQRFVAKMERQSR